MGSARHARSHIARVQEGGEDNGRREESMRREAKQGKVSARSECARRACGGKRRVPRQRAARGRQSGRQCNDPARCARVSAVQQRLSVRALRQQRHGQQITTRGERKQECPVRARVQAAQQSIVIRAAENAAERCAMAAQ